MPSSAFAIPVPEDLDVELSLEDQRRRAKSAKKSPAGKDSSEQHPSEGRGATPSETMTNSFSDGMRPLTNPDSGMNNESMLSRFDDPEPLLLPIPSPTHVPTVQPSESAFAALLGGGSSPSNSPAGRRARMKEVKVFSPCFYPGKRHLIKIKANDGATGSEVVAITLKTVIEQDKALRGKISEDPRNYKLVVADDTTGEEGDISISSDGVATRFGALFMKLVSTPFPSHKEMYPAVCDDVRFTVDVIGAQCKQTVLLPADMKAEELEEVLKTKLNLLSLVKGSVVVRYGPTEIGLERQYGGFGVGAEAVEGEGTPTVGSRTMLSLYRFGVRELALRGKLKDDAPPAPSPTPQNSFRGVDEQEAQMYRQFEVIKINKFGKAQERVLGIDADRIYNMKPGSEVGKTKNPERSIKDIIDIKTFPDPCYCEVEYRGVDTDKIHCRSAAECYHLVEKLRVLKKLYEQKRDRGDSSAGGLGRVRSFFFGK